MLRAWTESPARFREDANAEEDLALGGYRDRAVVELAQNAADAAARAGVAGRLLLRLADGQLCASNTGEPLEAAGVTALASLRASAKRGDHSVGRFGVGFAAVLALTDAPAVCSSTGSVRFDRAVTAAACTAVPELSDELGRRGGHVPVLRLPFPDPRPPEPGWTTTVRLPLRDGAAHDTARRLLAEVGPVLLLALPALAEVVVEVDGTRRAVHAARDGADVVVVDDGVTTRWRLAGRTGRLDPALLADRPVEERARPSYTLTWALPVEPATDDALSPAPWPPGVARVVHAPTPTAEPASLPALLLASFPLDPSRRHVAQGPLTDQLTELAGSAYAELVRAVPDPALVPVGLPAGALDAALHRAVLAALRETAFLPGGARPADAVAVAGADDALLAVLADVVPNALPRRWTRARAAVDALGVTWLGLADLVDALATVTRPPAWWHGVYAALAGLPGLATDELGALSVPLADGRTVRGPRGLLLPGPDLPAPPAGLALRLVHPAAAHPLLARLGALEASAATVLDDPAVRAAVESDDELADARELALWVLRLVAASGTTVAERPWLGELLLPDTEGQLAEPAELCLPGSPVEAWADEEAYGRVDPALREQVGDAALAAVGVREGLPVLRVRDWTPAVDELPPVADVDGWVHEVIAPVEARAESAFEAAFVPEAVLVEDLDLVADDAWPRALASIGADPSLRAAVLDPVAVVVDGRRHDLTSYGAWWLSRHATVAGRHLASFSCGDDPALLGLFAPLPPELAGLDVPLLQALGVVTSVTALLAAEAGPDLLLDRLADPAVELTPQRLAGLYAALARVPVDRVHPPELLRCPRGQTTVLAPAERVVVLDRPDLLPVVRHRAHLRVPLPLTAALADVLDVALASSAYAIIAAPDGTPAPVPDAVRAVAPYVPAHWVEHDRLEIAGVEVEWLVADDTVHAVTLAGLARGLAWRAGRWADRHLLLAALLDPAADDLRAEADLDG